MKLLKGGNDLTFNELKPNEIQILEEAINSDYKTVNIRLQQGGYQYDLAKAIASFELEKCFPNVKDLIKRLYGEEKANDSQFVRKIQTILKKMEKAKVVKILPKDKPWELQRYALSSFKFIDVDKNLVILAADPEIEQAQNLLNFTPSRQNMPTAKRSHIKIKILTLILIMVISYIEVLLSLLQSKINPMIFIPAFYIAVTCALILGKLYVSPQK